MRFLRHLAIALQFLTRLPVRLATEPAPEDLGRSMLHYPAVGALLGLILLCAAWLLPGEAGLLRPALVLCVWTLLTGAFHLDGLADSADAWAGDRGEPQRSLAIMKDPNCGPIGATAIMLVLLLKFAALEVLLNRGDWAALWLAPVLGRAAPVLLFATVPYVRPNGIGAALARHLPQRQAIAAVGAACALAPLAVGMRGLWLLAALAGLFWGLRRLMLRHLGGATGDTAGALVELTECLSLTALALA
jgi:adenosylcobinamide-GDP ribazoletransferase